MPSFLFFVCRLHSHLQRLVAAVAAAYLESTQVPVR
jgi:hypothetical protein